MTYEELLIESDNNNLTVKEKPLPVSKGRIRPYIQAPAVSVKNQTVALVLCIFLGFFWCSSFLSLKN